MQIVDAIIDFLRYTVFRLKRPGFSQEDFEKTLAAFQAEQNQNSHPHNEGGDAKRRPFSKNEPSKSNIDKRQERLEAEKKRKEALISQYRNEISRTKVYLKQELDKHNYFPTQFEIQRHAKVSEEAWNAIVKDYFGFETILARGAPDKTVIVPIQFNQHVRKLAKLLLSETENSLLLNKYIPRSRFNIKDIHDIGNQIMDKLRGFRKLK